VGQIDGISREGGFIAMCLSSDDLNLAAPAFLKRQIVAQAN
jgi:hypothetical protein